MRKLLIVNKNLLAGYMNLTEIFAENVKKARKAQSLSQDELAYLAGLHRTYVGAIERSERNISIKNIEKIAKALNIDPHKLLELSQEHE